MEHDPFPLDGRCGCGACSGAFAADDGNSQSSASDPGSAAAPASTDYIDALINEYEYKWSSSTPGLGATVTYSFLTSAPDYYISAAPESRTFAPMSTDQQNAVHDILAMYSEVANITFIEVSGVGSITFGTADLVVASAAGLIIRIQPITARRTGRRSATFGSPRAIPLTAIRSPAARPTRPSFMRSATRSGSSIRATTMRAAAAPAGRTCRPPRTPSNTQ